MLTFSLWSCCGSGAAAEAHFLIGWKKLQIAPVPGLEAIYNKIYEMYDFCVTVQQQKWCTVFHIPWINSYVPLMRPDEVSEGKRQIKTEDGHGNQACDEESTNFMWPMVKERLTDKHPIVLFSSVSTKPARSELSGKYLSIENILKNV